MRKITRQAKEHFESNSPFYKGNTRVVDGKVYVHNNLIIERREDGVYASFAGWDTNLTKERLNGILGHWAHFYKGGLVHIRSEQVTKPVTYQEFIKVI